MVNIPGLSGDSNGHEEEIIPLEDIDPQTCEDMGGIYTEDGNCLMRKVGEEDGKHIYKPLKWKGKKKPQTPQKLK